MTKLADGADVTVVTVAAPGGDNMTVRKFNPRQPTVASMSGSPTQQAPSCPATGPLAQQSETPRVAAGPTPSRAPRAPSCPAAQTEAAVAAGRAQAAPRRQAAGDFGPQPGKLTPWEALQIVKADLAAHGPVFDKPPEEVLACLGHKPGTDGEAALPALLGRAPSSLSVGERLGDSEKQARQARLLAFIDSFEPRMEELLNHAVQAGADPEDLIALLSDGTVLPPYTNLVPRSEVAAEVAILRGQVHAPLLDDEWDRPTPGVLLAIVLFEGVQAVSVFPYSVHRDLGAQA